MLPTTLSIFTLGSTTVLYVIDPRTKQVGLELCPNSLVAQRVTRDEFVCTPATLVLPQRWQPVERTRLDSLVQLQCVGDDYAGSCATHATA